MFNDGSTTTKTLIDRAEAHNFHVYNRFPVVFERGEGVHLYDTDGTEYLDFAAGIGVMALGYGDAKYTDALQKQVATLTHTSNLFYHPPMIAAAEKATKISGMDYVFFTNSGAEAIEGALKTAKKYAYENGKTNGAEVIAMEHSFHGRTVGAVSVTGTTHYREPFYPLMDGVRFATFNDFESVKNAVTEKTCAIILEPVQGEGGIYPADEAFLRDVRDFCDEHDILLIFDEIQCGMGRTGSYFTFQKYGVQPDILTSAKALGGGVPVGAFFVNEKVAAHSLVPGDHGTTYGGNPLVCAAVSATIDIFEARDINGHVSSLTPYFESALEEIKSKFDFIIDHRGMGFMQGLVLDESRVKVGDVVTRALLDEHLVLLSAGGNVLRFLPPLVIDNEHIDEMKSRLNKVLNGII